MMTLTLARASLIGVLLLAVLAGCGPAAEQARPDPTASAAARPAASSSRPPSVAPRSYLEGLALPVGLHFAPDGRLFFAEVNSGRIRVAEHGVLRPEPFATLQVAEGREHGLLGITLDPRFVDNGYLYAYYTVPKKSGKPDFNRVVRLTERDGVGSDVQVLFDKIPADVKGSHNGGRLRFGPDGKLYVATGTPGDEGGRAQEIKVMEGKILRLNPDGSVPADNPVPSSPVYAYGLRNPYGMDFHPRTGRLYAVDNGPKGYDELNVIRPGGNYGTPVVVGAPGDARFIDPIWNSGSERLGLSGMVFYSGGQIPEYAGDMFFCVWNTGVLRRVRLGGPELEQVEEMEDLAADCRLDVAEGPDGALYVAGINRIERLGR